MTHDRLFNAELGMRNYLFCIFLFAKVGIVSPFQKIVDRNAEIIGDLNQSFIISFSFARLITTDCVLIHREIKRKLELRDIAVFT